MSNWLSTLISAATLLSMGVSAFVAWFVQKSRADMLGLQGLMTKEITEAKSEVLLLKINILETIGEKLDDYVRTQRFNDYSVAHGSEHKIIDTELIRIRDWRHNEESLLRTHESELEDLKEKLKDLREDKK